MSLDKKAFITGYSSGIGYAITQSLLNQGYLVTGLSRTLNQSLAQHPNFQHIPFDLYDLKKLEIFCKKELAHHTYDLAILSAGAGFFGKIENLSYQNLLQSTHLNYIASAYLLKGLVPSFKNRQMGQIFVIGSEAALKGKKEGSAYCGSKFALRGFIQSLQDEIKAYPQICLINPGLVRTPFFDQLHFKPAKNKDAALHPEKIVALVNNYLNKNSPIPSEIELQPPLPKITKL